MVKSVWLVTGSYYILVPGLNISWIFSSMHTWHLAGANEEWDSFLHEWSRWWGQGVLKLAKYQRLHPVLRVFYEDLKSNTSFEVERMLHFLDMPYSSIHLQHQLRSGLQELHRQRDRSFDPFTQQQRETLREMLRHVMDELTMKGFRDSQKYVKRYLLTCTYVHRHWLEMQPQSIHHIMTEKRLTKYALLWKPICEEWVLQWFQSSRVCQWAGRSAG